MVSGNRNAKHASLSGTQVWESNQEGHQFPWGIPLKKGGDVQKLWALNLQRTARARNFTSYHISTFTSDVQKRKQRTETLLQPQITALMQGWAQEENASSLCWWESRGLVKALAINTTVWGTESPPGTTNATTHRKNAMLRTSTHLHVFWQSLITLSPVNTTTQSKSHPHRAWVLVHFCSIHIRVPGENTQGIHTAKIK